MDMVAVHRMRLIACTLASAMLTVQGCTAPQLLCGRPEVLVEVGRLVKNANLYNKVDPTTVAEAPTTRADAVICTVAVNSIGYFPTEAGWVPQPIQERRRYDVSVADNRFFVAVRP